MTHEDYSELTKSCALLGLTPVMEAPGFYEHPNFEGNLDLTDLSASMETLPKAIIAKLFSLLEEVHLQLEEV